MDQSEATGEGDRHYRRADEGSVLDSPTTDSSNNQWSSASKVLLGALSLVVHQVLVYFSDMKKKGKTTQYAIYRF